MISTFPQHNNILFVYYFPVVGNKNFVFGRMGKTEELVKVNRWLRAITQKNKPPAREKRPFAILERPKTESGSWLVGELKLTISPLRISNG
jgi:hypothetical protein